MRKPTQSAESSRNTSMEIKYGKLEIVQLWTVENTLVGKPHHQESRKDVHLFKPKAQFYLVDADALGIKCVKCPSILLRVQGCLCMSDVGFLS